MTPKRIVPCSTSTSCQSDGISGSSRIFPNFNYNYTYRERALAWLSTLNSKAVCCGSSQPFLEVGQGIASIARSKAVYSAIDSHALGGLKTRMVFANSTARQTDVSEQKIALSTSVEPEVARPLRQEHPRFWGFQLERILPMRLAFS